MSKQNFGDAIAERFAFSNQNPDINTEQTSVEQPPAQETVQQTPQEQTEVQTDQVMSPSEQQGQAQEAQETTEVQEQSGADAEGSAEGTGDQSGSDYLTDAAFLNTETEASTASLSETPETTSQEINQTPTLSPDGSPWEILSKELGSEIKSAEDVRNYIAEQTPRLVPGIDAETNALLVEAREKGILLPDEISSLELKASWAKVDPKELAANAIMEQAQLLDMEMTPEQAIAEVEDMSASQLREKAYNYAMRKDNERKTFMEQVQSKVQESRAAMARQQAEREKAIQQYNTEVTNVVNGLETIPGTGVVLTDQHKQLLQKAMTDQKFLQKLIFGDGSPENVKQAIGRVAFMAFNSSVMKNLSAQAGNQTRRELIDQARGNTTPQQGRSTSVNEVNPNTQQSHMSRGFEDFLAGKFFQQPKK